MANFSSLFTKEFYNIYNMEKKRKFIKKYRDFFFKYRTPRDVLNLNFRFIKENDQRIWLAQFVEIISSKFNLYQNSLLQLIQQRAYQLTAKIFFNNKFYKRIPSNSCFEVTLLSSLCVVLSRRSRRKRRKVMECILSRRRSPWN